MTVPRRLLVALAVLLAAGGLSACGNHQTTGPLRTAETEGIYLDISGLKYQVQVSRQLNPSDTQDAPFLKGIPAADHRLKPDEVWFAVLMRVQNEGSQPLRPSADIRITDTQDEVFTPIALDGSNLYAYRSNDPIPGGEVIPLLDTPGYDSASRGAVILFKLTLSALNNRPLDMRVNGRTVPQQTGIFTLDV